MSLFPYELRNMLCLSAIFGVIGFAGCSNTCFIGVVNNGSGSLSVAAGNPPPVCSAQATMRVNAMKSPACKPCTAAARVDHIFVTLRGIQLRASVPEERDTEEWLEIEPELANEPRQIDLVGGSLPDLLVKNSVIPAGGYREVRLQFLSDSPANATKLPAENACGEKQWNCVVMGDGTTKALSWAGDEPELRMRIQNGDSDLLMVLPDGVFDLQLRLETEQVPSFSTTEGGNLVSVLVGRVSVTSEKWLIPDDEMPLH